MSLRIRTCIWFFFPAMFWTMISHAAEKRALLIMVGRYPSSSGWAPLSAQNDSRLIVQTLKNQGFKANNMVVLENQQATADNIRKSCEKLIQSTRRGDKVIVAFSGHGQQIFDINNDEADRLDEALVAYDAPKKADLKSYKGGNHILDDEIGIFVQQMKIKLGNIGHLLLLLDCCHAGTGARTDAQAFLRGGAMPIASGLWAHAEDQATTNKSGFDDGDFEVRGDGGVFVLLAGAAAGQQNYEVKDDDGKPFGALSYAFCEAIHRLKKNATYQGLFAGISSIITQKAPFQTPTIEGDATAEVLAGEMVFQTPTFELLQQQSAQYCQKIRLAVGELYGVFTNAVFDFVPKNTARGDSTAAVVKGKVIEADAFGATVELERPLPVETLRALQAVEVQKSFGNVSTGIFAGTFENTALKNKFLALIQSYPMLSLTSADKAVYEVRQNGQSIFLQNCATQMPIDSMALTDYAPEDCVERLLTLSRAELFRAMEFDNRVGKVTVKLEQAQNTASAGVPLIKIRTATSLILTNQGDSSVYVSIADIQPDGIIQVILPDQEIAQLKLLPGETRTIPLRVSPPLGMEMYKIFLTPTFLALNTLISSRGDAPIAHPLKQLFQKTYRGEMPDALNVNQLSVFSYCFKIVP